MLLDGTVTLDSVHNRKRTRRREVLALRSRIEIHGGDELERALRSRQGIVEARLKDGPELGHYTKAVRGSSDNSMTNAEVDANCEYQAEVH